MPIQSVNDFVVRFANVNGSGSASANELFARSVLRMGVPVAPRNIFPSNIQGLPTWYEVRISEAGHLGARGGTDLMVAMNPQTWDNDVAGIEPGGYLLYDSTKPMPKSKFRDDITVIGVPLTAICNREYSDPRQRQLFKNIVYVGALSALLDMDVGEMEKLIAEQFKGKEKLFDANKNALHLGRDWVMMNVEHPIGLRLKRADAVGDRIFIEGNSAAPEMRAGATCYLAVNVNGGLFSVGDGHYRQGEGEACGTAAARGHRGRAAFRAEAARADAGGDPADQGLPDRPAESGPGLPRRGRPVRPLRNPALRAGPRPHRPLLRRPARP